jgi:hypothetical protein
MTLVSMTLVKEKSQKTFKLHIAIGFGALFSFIMALIITFTRKSCVATILLFALVRVMKERYRNLV